MLSSMYSMWNNIWLQTDTHPIDVIIHSIMVDVIYAMAQRPFEYRNAVRANH